MLPVDPGYTLGEVATMLRVTRDYLRSLLSTHAPELDPPVYRRLSEHPRQHRLLSWRDVQVLHRHLLTTAVKPQSHAWVKRRALR